MDGTVIVFVIVCVFFCVIVFVCVIVKVWKMCLPWLLGWVALQINRRISGFLDFQQKLSLLDRPCHTLAYTAVHCSEVYLCSILYNSQAGPSNGR